MEFGPGDRVLVSPLRSRRDYVGDLEAHLLLYYTGKSRQAAAIIEKQINATVKSEAHAIEAMHALKRAALEMKEALLRGRISECWRFWVHPGRRKKRMAEGISNPQIERAARAATEAGALGLKVSGAGGGGFMIVAVAPPQRYAVFRALERVGGAVFSFFVDRGVESWKTESAVRDRAGLPSPFAAVRRGTPAHRIGA